MGGSQKFAIYLACVSLIGLAVACFMYIKGPQVDAVQAVPQNEDVSQTVKPPTSELSPSQPAPVLVAIRPSHTEIIRQLKDEAAKRGLYWKVWCTAFYEGDKEEYQGIATKGKMFNVYVEDGAGNYWHVLAVPTQDGAAFALLQAVHKEPNAKPMHKDVRKRVSCNSTLEGAPR